MNKKVDEQCIPENFSLGIGGPFYQLFFKLRLLKKPLLLYKRRITIIALFVWLPLLVMAVLGGTAFSGVNVPFIFDIDVHVRFLLVLPMLIYAEVIAHERFPVIVEQFLKCNIIAMEDRKKFNAIIVSAMRLRSSVIAEIIILGLVYTVGHWILMAYIPLGVPTWFSTSKNNMTELSSAGLWYIYVGLPFFQFILVRWYFRIIVWYRFLWQISRLPLKLNSLHPDRAGGLGFLSNSIYALEPFLLAHSVLLSGMIFNRIWNAGAAIADFKIEIISILIFVLLLPLIPLLFFIFQMIKEKQIGTLNYSVIANRYVNNFRQKWIATASTNSTSILGTPDIQSLADLFNSFEVSNKMRVIPFGKSSIMALVIITALPLVPLVFTLIPLEKIISQIFGVIF